MSKILQRLNWLALWFLGAVLGLVLVVRIWPGARLAAGAPADNYWTGWKTLEVYPSHVGDPVKLVKITKAGREVVPGTYRLPEISGDVSHNVHAVGDWLNDASFLLKSQTSRNIVSVGLAVVFPTRSTEGPCPSVYADAEGTCPSIVLKALHWGQIPAKVASALEARYRAEASKGGRFLFQDKEPLRFAPSQEIVLSPAGRTGNGGGESSPISHSFSNVMNGILFEEGIEEASNAEPCEVRATSKPGCAFREVSKFNIGVDVVYFEDGTIWGNYGYGYALPNPDGIFTRVDVHGFPVGSDPTSAAN